MTDQTIPADKLREVIDHMVAYLETDAGDDEDRGFHRATALWRDALDGLLPAPLAEIRFGGRAMWRGEEVLIVSAHPDDDGEVVVYFRDEDFPKGSDHGWVKPSVLLQHPDDAVTVETETDTDTPEPGEAWLVEVDGENVNAVVAGTGFLHSTPIRKWTPGHMVTPITRLVPETQPVGDVDGAAQCTDCMVGFDGDQHSDCPHCGSVNTQWVSETPRKTLVTREDYRDVPVGTVITYPAFFDDGVELDWIDTAVKYGDGHWRSTGSVGYDDNHGLAGAARTVIWEPEA